MAKICFVTYEKFPDFSSSDRKVAEVILTLDKTIEVDAKPWTSKIDWKNYDLIILRSCWDYYRKETRFKNWLNQLKKDKCQVFNPPKIVLQNIHKSYLLKFKNLEIKLPKTILVKKGYQISKFETILKRLKQNNDWKQVVIKPAVSASGAGVSLIRKNKLRTDLNSVNKLLQTKDILIQEFLPEVPDVGEYSLIFINNNFSHSILKTVDPSKDKLGFRNNSKYGGKYSPIKVSNSVIRQAKKILESVDGSVLYARVDGVIRGNQFILLELELTEPSLYFDIVPEKAAINFAKNILKKLKTF
jgi:glutathione synthase/RimK-type ligase-like ATP-grasp enzyme